MQSGSSPLDQLADIHLPAPVSWWPLAPGWWLLLTLLAILIFLGYLLRRRQLQRRYRQYASGLLQAAYNQFLSDGQSAIYLQQLSQLLRRVARTSYKSRFEPNLKGEAWLSWLDLTCPKRTGSFAEGCGRILLNGPYQKNPQGDIEALHQLCLEWIHHHSLKPVSQQNHEVSQHV